MFKKVLIANRGEIAVRIARTLRNLQIRSVAVYSDADAGALHVGSCDEAFRIGPAPVRESYLNRASLLGAARDSGAEAIHPGYGLLSEDASFARAVAEAGLVFVGPSADTLSLLGDKLRARELARSISVDPPPGTLSPVDPDDSSTLLAEGERIGYPLLIKAAAGGGGIGMARASSSQELQRAAKACRDRAGQAFADGRVYLERYVDRPRHVEVQVLVDREGTAVALGERECSVQRRHQKLIEETPSPANVLARSAGSGTLRETLQQKALLVLGAAGYLGAGTVEFLLDRSGNVYFLEVNARLQVEHPITELVTGLDLVEAQLRIASGAALSDRWLTSSPKGHAVEVRLYAEDPARGFVPQPGKLVQLQFPDGISGVRIDAGYAEGSEITPFYDPLIAKVSALGATRDQAIGRLVQALERIQIRLLGPRGPRVTNRELLLRVLNNPEFLGGDYDTHLLERLGEAR